MKRTTRNVIARAARIEPLEQRMLLSLSPVGPEFRVNTTTSHNEVRSSVAMDADGDFVAVWTSYVPAPADGGVPPIGDVFAQRYSAAGVPQGVEFRVNTTTTNSQRLADVTMDDAGNFVVAWTSDGQDGAFDGIFVRRYNAAGVPQSGELQVNTFTSSNQVGPSVAMDSNGDFVVVWTSYLQEGSDPNIYAQRYNAVGVRQGGEFRVNAQTTGTHNTPSVAMDDAGNFVIAWTDFVQDGSGLGVYARRYNAAGAAQGTEFRVNTFTTSSQSLPCVAVDADGDSVIAWQSLGQDGSGYGVYAKRYNSVGVPQGSEFRANTFTPNPQTHASAAIDADGDFVIAWSSLQDGSDYGSYAQSYNLAGVAEGAEFRVNSFTTGFQGESSAAMDNDGNAVIAWTSDAQDGFAGGIYAQRYAGPVAPAISSSTFLFQTAPHRLRFVFTQNVSGSLSASDLVLQNLTTGQTIPSGQLSLSYASATNTATFSYTGNASGISGVLPDGNYRATLLAAGITNPFGRPMAVNHVFDFFFLDGDADHNGTVNLLDFNSLSANFGQSGRNFSQGDFNYDTTVDLLDFNILSARFGQILGPTALGENPVRGPRGDDQLRILLEELLRQSGGISRGASIHGSLS
jgi:hypothetical protein